jgi:hypothetical protein
MKPEWAAQIKLGDWLTVSPDIFGRGGQSGMVIEDPDEGGVTLDFFSSHSTEEYISIEYWQWDELVPAC